jgi:hypothetical protein
MERTRPEPVEHLDMIPEIGSAVEVLAGPWGPAMKCAATRSCGDGPAERTVYRGVGNLQRGPMPITAKLSRQFYEKLGDEVTNELVTWLNAVDDSYRREFRDLFDANFGQVRAEMAQLRAEMRGEMSMLRGEMSQLRSELRADVRARVGEAEKRLIGWTFKLWVGQVAVTIGVILAARAIWE